MLENLLSHRKIVDNRICLGANHKVRRSINKQNTKEPSLSMLIGMT